jgi:hypothetical protein
VKLISSLRARLRRFDSLELRFERMQEALGRIEARQLAGERGADLRASEFRAFSQWGEDGIIQRLVHTVPIERKLFVEFGVQDYSESNTRFLLLNDNWSGLVMDGDEANIAAIRRSDLFWRHNIKAQRAFVTRENIDELLRGNGVEGDIGLLSIDIDGNDYWVWEAISSIAPRIVIAEYNARFGPQRSVTIPNDPAFTRQRAHFSMIYYGASLAALTRLGNRKGYALVGCNSAGNNAFFVRRDCMPASLSERSAESAYVASAFREARDEQGRLQFLSPEEESRLLRELPLVEVEG